MEARQYSRKRDDSMATYLPFLAFCLKRAMQALSIIDANEGKPRAVVNFYRRAFIAMNNNKIEV
jgi:hypothetical protein